MDYLVLQTNGINQDLKIYGSQKHWKKKLAYFLLLISLQAFNDRGGDYRTSHDFEDIIYVLDNRITIVSEIEKTQEDIKKFFKMEFEKILQSQFVEEIFSSHIHPLMLDGRYPIVIEK